jgi:hypothetical protein
VAAVTGATLRVVTVCQQLVVGQWPRAAWDVVERPMAVVAALVVFAPVGAAVVVVAGAAAAVVVASRSSAVVGIDAGVKGGGRFAAISMPENPPLCRKSHDCLVAA